MVSKEDVDSLKAELTSLITDVVKVLNQLQVCVVDEKQEVLKKESAFNDGPNDEGKWDARCAICGVHTKVPFKPTTGGAPIKCRKCFMESKK